MTTTHAASALSMVGPGLRRVALALRRLLRTVGPALRSPAEALAKAGARPLATAALSAVVLASGVAARSGTVVLDIPGKSDATPWIAARGSLVAVAWGASADGKADVFVATSRDGGEIFGAPVRVNVVAGEGRLGGEFPPRVAIHTAAGDATPTIVVLWNARGAATEVKAARSRDGGTTFDAPVVLQSVGAGGDRGWPALTVDRDGVAHAIWLDHRGLAARKAAAKGSGGQAAVAGSHHVHASGATADGSVMAQGSSLYHASVGAASNAPARAEHELTKGVCYCCKTALATGPDGALFAAWRHVYPGDLRDIALSVSRDGGRSFSAPARVSEDGWAINGCPDDGPSVAVDAGGTAHIVWPTVVGTTEPEGALFYSTTKDGQHFTPRVRVPTLGGPKPTYPQIAVSPTGRLLVAWEENTGGQRVAAMREVKSGAGATTFGEAITIAAGGSANHPVIAATADSVVAAWATGGDASRIEVRRIGR